MKRTLLGCHNIILALQPKAVLILCSLTIKEIQADLQASEFPLCSHKGDLAHCLTDLGCYFSQEDPCTPSSPLQLLL